MLPILKKIILFLTCLFTVCSSFAQEELWDKTASGKEHPNIQWFKDAKFGLFIHWGLYSKLGGVWKGKRYYGSGEWIMNQAKIPAADYEKEASNFNPVDFNAEALATLAQDAGIKYVVITAKHHEGFAMYNSKVSDFNIVKATPYKKDPMRLLADATRKRGMKFGFYYSQFADWHEPNGGRNNWDFDETKKDYQKYYTTKAIPQIKELMTNYGSLGLVWFDTPGGLTKQQTQQFVDSLRQLQPQCLFSSRVGQGLGDYRDFGDSEVPPSPIFTPWESIYTHNDSWGYIQQDLNFKTSSQIIQLLAEVASKGGNLMLNVGPDGNGNIPYYAIKYLRETGKWLAKNGESIYGTTYGFIPMQPWGVTTSKPNKLYVHVFNVPDGRQLLLPNFNAPVASVNTLVGEKPMKWKKFGSDIIIDLGTWDTSSPDNVIVVHYQGAQPTYVQDLPITISPDFQQCKVDAVFAKTFDSAKVKSLTFSHYYGDWKHETCVTGMVDESDSIKFNIRVTKPGDYRLVLAYACPSESARQEGNLRLNNTDYLFRTLRTSEYSDSKNPLMFIEHSIAIVSIPKAGIYPITIYPLQKGKELFKLKSIIFEPIK